MKKFLIVILALAMFLFVGCSDDGAQTSKKDQANKENTQAQSDEKDQNKDQKKDQAKETSSKKKVIIDDLGHEIELPEKIERIVIADLPPLVHAYHVANDGIDKLVGAPKDNALVDTMLPVVYPEVKELSSDFRNGDEINMEELLSLNPDLILYRSDNEKSGEMIRNSGVKAIAFQTFNADKGNAVTPVVSWLKTLGQILDKEEKVAELIKDSNETIGFVQSRMWNIKDQDKATMLYLNGAGNTDDTIKVSGEGLFGSFWAGISGAKDLAVGDIKGAKVISTEQFHSYNPDVLFTVFSDKNPKEFLADPNYKGIKAVESGRVHSAPLGMFAWYGPSTDAPLSLLWHSKLLYPENFKDVDVIEKTKEHYLKYYKYEITDENIEFLFGEDVDDLIAK